MFDADISSEKAKSNEPIAIVGMACRFPGGAEDLDQYWALMRDSRDGIVEIPKDRLNIDDYYDDRAQAPGKIFVRHGGFLQNPIDAFDAQYFGMSPREAAYLDPQQRLLMEVAFETLENAGIPAERLAGTDTGVFVGGFMVDGMLTQFSPLARNEIGQHTAVSSTLTILSNRLSYMLDLHGPSFTLDTACSSSLVAMHQACQAIRNGDCSMALVGGVNVIFRPETLIAMCKGGFLSRDGRSKSFDARADGYGRGEGAGMILLKPLSQAQADGDRIHAIVRGSGTNQDGRTDGITVPNGDAQANLIRKVCEDSNCDPSSIGYVEAHGTGTAIGDPIEMSALGRVFGASREKGNPCLVGSVKANIGHLEAAAGIAAVIKTVLCLKNAEIPPVANLEKANPAIQFDAWNVDVPREIKSFEPVDNAPRRAGVNSFGYGGSNAHVLLEEAPQDVVSHGETRAEPNILLLSARSDAALHAAAERMASRLEGVTADGFADLCHSLATRRSHYENRVAIVGETVESAREALAAFLAGTEDARVITGNKRSDGVDPVFVFTGMGPQWWGMGRELFETQPIFRAFAERVDREFTKLSGWSLLEEMLRSEDDSRVTETQIAQPANFLLQGGLLELLRSWGVNPAAVVGHSVGEVSSAYAAGALSFEDAVRISYFRSQMQARTSGIGAMLAIGASADDAEALLEGCEDLVSIAAVNGPNSVTLSGNKEELERIAEELEGAGVFNRFLKVETGYHSPVMDPLLDPLEAALDGVSPSEADIDLYSTVSGDLAVPGDYGPAYWRDNVRGSVLFANAIDTILDDGHDVFLEVGPHPVLSGGIRECLLAANVEGTLVPTLRRKKPEIENMLRAVAELYVSGARVDWGQFHATRSGKFAEYPSYPWQREQHWNEGEAARKDRMGDQNRRPLLGAPIAAPGQMFSAAIGKTSYPYVFDHIVEDSIVLPGAAYVEIGLTLGDVISGNQSVRIEGLDFSQALLIGELEEPVVMTRYDAGQRRYEIFSAPNAQSSDWTRHSGGLLSFLSLGEAPAVDLAQLRTRCSVDVPKARHYEMMHARGLQYGPLFQGIETLRLSEDLRETLAHIVAPEGLVDRGEKLHPALLDACFQALIALVPNEEGAAPYVPVEIADIRLHRAAGHNFWCHGQLHEFDELQMTGDLCLFDETGQIVVELLGVSARSLGQGEDSAGNPAVNALMQRFELHVQPLDNTDIEPGQELVLLGGSEALLSALSAAKVAVSHIDAISETSLQSTLAGVGETHLVDARFLEGADSDPVGLDRSQSFLALMHAIPQDGVKRRLSLLLPHMDHRPDAVSLQNASVLGLARVAANEYADLELRFIQYDAHSVSLEDVTTELLSGATADDVVLTAGGRKERRLVPVTMQTMTQDAQCRAPFGAPEADEVDVEVLAAYPSGEKREYTDIVARRIGETDAGGKLLVRVDGEAQRYMRLKSAAVLECPDIADLSDPEATGLVSMCIAHAGLVKSARLQPKQSVLLFPAQSPQLDGFGAIATALGLEPCEIADGNVEQIDTVARRYPEGVDSVCLAETGEMASDLAKQVAEFGSVIRFVTQNGRTETLSLPAQNCTGIHLDTARLASRAADTLQESLAAVAELVRGGALPKSAFAQFANASQRFVVGQEDPVARKRSLAEAQPPVQIRADGCYLITGGFGGFGFEIAKWLAAKGAGTIALVSRKGMQTPDAKEMIAELEQAGAKAFGIAADISNPDHVARALNEVQEHGVPLRGIFHAAAVLDDKPVYSLEPEQLQRVMMPKALGAWNLHQATRDLDLDCFVMLSSIASLLGSPGQGAYVAANSVLDALAQERRSAGLAGTAINLGALSQVGMAARHEGVEKHLARVGVGSLTPDEALSMFDRILTWNPIALSAARMDWALWGGAYGKWAGSSRYSHLMPSQDDTQNGSDQDSFARMTAAERAALVDDALVTLVCGVLRLDRAQLDQSRSLLNMGVDSLMAMELQAGIEKQLGLKVPTLELMKGIAFADLVKNLTEKFEIACAAQSEDQPASGTLESAADALGTPPEEFDIAALLADLSSMDEAEIERAMESFKSFEESNQ